jgi:hypothetical protein
MEDGQGVLVPSGERRRLEIGLRRASPKERQRGGEPGARTRKRELSLRPREAKGVLIRERLDEVDPSGEGQHHPARYVVHGFVGLDRVRRRCGPD